MLLRILLLVLLSFNSNANIEASSIDLNDETHCLALNIYHEARGEHTAGMRAVADVVMNRVKSIQFPNNICEVVKQGPVYESWKTKRFPDLPDEQRIYNPRKGKCQFSWYCDGKSDEPTELDAWQRAFEVSILMIEDGVGLGLTDGADHYHADYIDPHWNKNMTFIVSIEKHKFYKSNR